MKKTIYLAVCDRINGDSFDLCITFNKTEALSAAENDLAHMTDSEREKSHTYVQVRDVEVLDGESAKDTYNRLLDEDEWDSSCNIIEVE